MESNANEKLEVALNALHKCEEHSLAGLFALEVMHEVRNPLDALTNLLHLASGDMDLAQVLQYIRDAQDQIASLHEIAGQSLSLARVTQHEIPVELTKLIEAAIKVHHRRNTVKQVNLARDLGPANSITVKGWEDRASAVQSHWERFGALADGGAIAVRVRKRGENLYLLVADNGSCIAPENTGRLFEPFFTTKQDQGNGLGLALSKKILERHQGTIRVRSSQDANGREPSSELGCP